jgi:hypothetical protein
MTKQKKSIRGTPTMGLITTQTMPTTKEQQAVAGRQETQHATASMLFPRKGPMHGMQSAITSSGPKKSEKPSQRRAKPTKRRIQVRVAFSLCKASNSRSLFRDPILKSSSEEPEHNHESGAVQATISPFTFLPRSVAAG